MASVFYGLRGFAYVLNGRLILRREILRRYLTIVGYKLKQLVVVLYAVLHQNPVARYQAVIRDKFQSLFIVIHTSVQSKTALRKGF